MKGDHQVVSIVLPNQSGYFKLTGGLDTCILEKVTIDPERQQLIRSDPVDVRDRKVIETLSHGPIKIVKRSKRRAVLRLLKDLKQFFRLHPAECIEKVLPV